MKKSNVHKLLYWTIYIINIFMLIGCYEAFHDSEVKYRRAEHNELVRSGESTIVFYRVISDVPKPKKVFYLPYGGGVTHWRQLSSFKTGGKFTPIYEKLNFNIHYPAYKFSNKTLLEGWEYLLLEPNLYYIKIRPLYINTYLYDPKSFPIYRFNVPPKSRLIYLGSLQLPSYKQPYFNPDDVVLRNEENMAKNIANEFFPEFKIQTILLERHEGPVIFEIPDSRK